MPSSLVENIVRYLKPTADGLRDLLIEELKDMDYKIITDDDNYVIGLPPGLGEPTCPKICLVAHMDTISRKQVKLILKGTKITNEDSVLGADDRAGVYCNMETIRNAKHKPLVIFTNYEESGGIGVRAMIKEKAFDEYAKHVHLFIEPDRQGHREYVWYNPTQPREVHAFIQKFGFLPTHGSYSDVKDLTAVYKIPHVNLAVGYYSQHTSNENLDILEMDFTQKAMAKMMTTFIPKIAMTAAEAGAERAYTYANEDRYNNRPTTGGNGKPSTPTTTTTSGTTKSTRGTFYNVEEYMEAYNKLHGGSNDADKSSDQETKASQALVNSKSLIVIQRNDDNAALFSALPTTWDGPTWDMFNSELSALSDDEVDEPDDEGEIASDIDMPEIMHNGKLITAREYAKVLQDNMTR